MTYSSPWLFRSIVLLATCLVSGIAGYAYGVQSAPAMGDAPSKVSAAAPAMPSVADADVLTAPPSWQRWPQATDF